MSLDGTAAVSSMMNNSFGRGEYAVSNNSEDIDTLIATTNKILATLKDPKPITIDGKTVIGWVDRELGAFV